MSSEVKLREYPPELPPYDVQGERSDEERLDRAMKAFVHDFGVTASIHMDSCIHCGMCAEACHFYQVTEDPKYTPIHKIEPFKQAYDREMGPFAPFMRALGLRRKVTLDELKEWESLIYDSCTLCGRCTMACPMGIDIAELVKNARHGMYEAGLVPDRLYAITTKAERQRSQFGTPEEFINTIHQIEKDFDIELPLDKPKADILVALAPGELEGHQSSAVAGATVLNYIGADWTFSSMAFEATNFGFLSGNLPLQVELTKRLIDHTQEIGAKTLLLPECGHAYSAARWDSGRWYGGELPVEVLHMTEFLARLVETNQIKLNKVGHSAAFHDPCQMVRRGGLIEAPRSILKALGIEVRELEDNKEMGFCCGGGGGVLANARAAPLRAKVFEMKRQQIDATKADRFITSCGQCRITFERGIQATGWDANPESLLEVVAANLVR